MKIFYLKAPSDKTKIDLKIIIWPTVSLEAAKLRKAINDCRRAKVRQVHKISSYLRVRFPEKVSYLSR